MEKVVVIYVTCPDKNLTLKIAKHCVQAKLVACANVFDGVTSVCEWKGKLEESSECILIMKGLAKNSEAIVAVVKQLHSYDCPCVLTLPVTGGSEEFLSWLSESCQPV